MRAHSAIQDDRQRGLTPRELGRRWRMSHDAIRGLIRAGHLKALNLAPARCTRPRFVILPQHIEEFERRREAAAVTVAPRDKRRKPVEIDYFPD